MKALSSISLMLVSLGLFAADTGDLSPTDVFHPKNATGNITKDVTLTQLQNYIGGSGGSSDSNWTNNAGVVQLVTRTNQVNLGIHDAPYPGQVIVQGLFDVTNTTFGALFFRAFVDQSQQFVTAYDFGLYPADENDAQSIDPGVYSYSGHFVNYLYQSNAVGVVYLTGGNIGLIGEAGIGHQTPILIGESAGLAGKAYGYGSLQIGTIGVGYSVDNGQTNVGVAGYAVTEGKTGTFVGVYGEVSTDTDVPPTYDSAAGLFDNRDSGLPVLIARTGSVTNNLMVLGDGKVYIGPTNASRVGIARVLAATATLDFDLSAVTFQDLTITVTGAATNDVVSLGIPQLSIANGVTYVGRVSAPNTVSVRATTSVGTPNPAPGVFTAMVTQS